MGDVGRPHRPGPPAHVLTSQPNSMGTQVTLDPVRTRGTPPQTCDSPIPHMYKVEAQPLGFQIPTWPLLASILGKPRKKTSFGGKGQALSSPEKKSAHYCVQEKAK